MDDKTMVAVRNWIIFLGIVSVLGGAYGLGWWIGTGQHGSSQKRISQLESELRSARAEIESANRQIVLVGEKLQAEVERNRKIADSITGILVTASGIAEDITGSADQLGSIGEGIADDLSALVECIKVAGECTGIAIDSRKRSEAIKTAIDAMEGTDGD